MTPSGPERKAGGADPADKPGLRRAARWDVRPAEGGYGVFGDDRPLRTPAGQPVVVASQALAAAIADELRAQAGHKTLNIAALANLRLTATAIDQVAAARQAYVEALVAYGETELLCYRAEHPADLVERQHAAWQPLLDWAAARFQAPLTNSAGVMPQAQPLESLAALRQAIAGYDDLRLAALAVAVPAAGSLVVGLAMIEGRLDAEQAFAVAEFDESYQIEHWGEDAEAAQRRAARRQYLEQVTRFLDLLK